MAVWQGNAISRDRMTELFRRGEVLPEGRINEVERHLLTGEKLLTTTAPGPRADG